jgi:hypothetical protein
VDVVWGEGCALLALVDLSLAVIWVRDTDVLKAAADLWV